jgi:UDP-N-acetylmuramoylalanine--D-glutamate ligase
MIPETWRRGGGVVAVVGLGKSGVAATRLLAREGVRVYASDASDHPYGGDAAAHLAALPGVELDVGRHDLAKIRAARAVVVSPGVPPEAPPLAAAREAGVPVVAELDLGFQALAGSGAGGGGGGEGERPRLIAVTGTNGKTTTTALVAHLLQAAGLRAAAAGNIGRPLVDVALSGDRYQWLAVEVSSFQLHDSPHFAPEIGVVTNLAPDHLDRYPSVDAYYADKRLLFRNAAAGHVWVLNGDDAAVLALARGVPGRHALFSLARPADAWYDGAERCLRLGGHGLVRRDELQPLGDHNVANALAAALAVHEAGVAPGVIAEGLRSFRALPHRLEPVREVNGVLWINDSKATNIASTVVAVEAMSRPFVLLLGGRHKGEPYTRLGPLLVRRGCRRVIAFGEAGPLVEQDLKGQVPLERGTTFTDVVERARRAARPGDAVLLSPACSSYDMFKNYEERGATFRALVERM